MIKSESYTRGIVISTVFSFFSKILVFTNSLLIAFYFGTASKIDIYFYSVSFITIVTGFFTALNQSVLIPQSMAIREREGSDEAMRFLNFFLFLYTAIGIFLTAVLYVNPVRIFTMLSNFDFKSMKENEHQLFLIVPILLLMLITNFLIDIATSLKYFTAPMISGIINSIFSLGFIVVFRTRMGVSSIALGLLLGYLCNTLFLLLLMTRQLKWVFKSSKKYVSRQVVKNIVYAQAGNITTFLYAYSPLYLLSGLGSGIITAFNFGNSISQLPNQLITTQFSSVVGIKFNELYAQQRFDKLNEIFLKSTKLLLFIMVPVSFMFFLFSDDIVTICLKRGAFNSDSVAVTSFFFKYLGFLLPTLVISNMLARLFTASQKIKQAFWYQIILNLILVVMLFILVGRLQAAGYLIGINFIYIANVFGAYYLCRYHFVMIDFKEVMLYILKLLLVNGAIAALVAFLIKIALPGILFAKVAMGVAAYGIVLLLLNWLLNINNDVRYYLSLFRLKLITLIKP